MYIYRRTNYSYSSYGLILQKIERLKERLQKKVDNAEEKLQRERADELQKRDIQNKSTKPASADSIKTSLLGDFIFNPGGAAKGTHVEILANGVKKGGTGTYLDILGSGDTGGVGMLDIMAGTSGGNLINIVTGISTGPSIIQSPTISSQIQDPLAGVAAENILKQIGSKVDIKV